MLGILLGIELTVCGSIMDENWIANNTKTYKNKAHLSRVIIFFTTKMSIYRPYMQIGDYFFSRRMYCRCHRPIFSLYLCFDSFIIILHFDTILRCHWNKRLSIMNTKTKPKTWHKKNRIDEIGWKKKKKEMKIRATKRHFQTKKNLCSLHLIFKWLFILSECD